MLFFSYHSVLRMADTIEHEESVMHHDSTLSASFDNLRRYVQQGNEQGASKSKRQRLKTKFEWKDQTVETLIILWENQPVLYNVSNPQYHVKVARRNAIRKIIDETKERGIFTSPSFDDVFRKINTLRTYFVAEKNKMEQSKSSGVGSSVIYKSRSQFYESLLFLADFVTPRNTQSNLERCQQSNSE